MRKNSTLGRLLALIPFFATWGNVVFAQTTISGRVTDQQAKAVVGATVKLVLSSGRTVAEAHSDDVGQFVMNSVPPGEYQIGASATGFAAVTRSASVAGGTHQDRSSVRSGSIPIPERRESRTIRIPIGD
jgi:hypothetical protein